MQNILKIFLFSLGAYFMIKFFKCLSKDIKENFK